MLIQLFLPLILKKTPFPVRIKEHAKVSIVVNKSYIIAPKPVEQIKVEPNIAMVKDLLVENIDGHVFLSWVKLLILLDPTLIYIDLL